MTVMHPPHRRTPKPKADPEVVALRKRVATLEQEMAALNARVVDIHVRLFGFQGLP